MDIRKKNTTDDSILDDLSHQSLTWWFSFLSLLDAVYFLDLFFKLNWLTYNFAFRIIL